MEVMLQDSNLCRLCANENENGIFIYNENETGISDLINKYLPLKISNDGRYPCTICPGCNIQLEATMGFFELIILGQAKLRELYKNQLEEIRRIQRDAENPNLPKPDALAALVQTFVVQHEDIENGESQEIFFQLLPDGTLYAPEHEQSLRAEGLEKPRRKRGRPPKPPPSAEPEPPPPAPEEEATKEPPEPEEEEEKSDCRKTRRRRKIPSRYKGAVQGKELERIFREEGVIDGNESPDEKEPSAPPEPIPEEEAEPKSETTENLETPEGDPAGELVVEKPQKAKARMIKTKKQRSRFTCDICGRIFQHYGRFTKHRNCHKDVKFECIDCQALFQTKESLSAHQKEENHSGEGVIEALNTEKEKPDTANKVKCRLCKKLFLTKQNYAVHMKAVHEGHRPYACQFCDKKFAYITSLKGHMVQHDMSSIKGFPCEVCGKVFNHPSSVVYHKQAEHNNGRRFVCNKCNKSFKHKQLLKRHQLVHSNKRPFQCNVCAAPFKTKTTLMNHQLIHTGVKKYFCNQCDQKFSYKTSLTLHYRWHSGEKPFHCVFCEKSFSQNGNLQEHIRIHTGVKPYSCDFCGTKFTTSSQYKLHIKRHTGERPWTCEVCKKSFLNKDTWRCHSRRHLAERPFNCTYCNRGFTEQWALRKHTRIHTGEKPYVCEYCDKAFSDSSNLSKHRKTHKKYLMETEKVWLNIENENALLAEARNDEPAILYKPDDNESQLFYMSFDKDGTDQPACLIVKNITTELDPNLKLEGSAEIGNQIDIPIQNVAISNLQITDEEGNPINFTTEDGHQLTVTTFDGEHLQVTAPDGTVLPVELNIDNTQNIQKEGEEIDEELDVVNLEAAGNEISVEDQIKDQTIEFTTEDGIKIKLVASNPELNAQYLSSV